MGFLKVIIFLTLVYGANGLSFFNFVVTKDCNVTRTFKVRKEVPYEEFHYLDDSLSTGQLDIEKKFRVEEIEINRTTKVCCNGYENYDEEYCLPICTKSCGSQGTCSSPEVCTCEKGHIFDEDLRNCKPICDPECKSGSCIGPNICSCGEGYKYVRDYNSWFPRSKPYCKPICNCTSEEICVEPHICQCKEGYRRDLMSRPDNLVLPKCSPICDEECVNAECIDPNECKCYENYTRIDKFTCDIRRYHVSDFAIPKNCTETDFAEELTSGYEIVLVNVTKPMCCDGYQNFEAKSCIPICNKLCGSQGICSAPNVCTCNPGYQMNKDLHECEPICERGCLNGHCIAPNMCACNDAYRKVLEFACAPICSQNCFMGVCTGPETCTCYKGFQLSEQNRFICEPVRPKY